MKALKDLIVQGPLEIRIKDDGKVVWVSTLDGTIFRACRVTQLMVIDERGAYCSQCDKYWPHDPNHFGWPDLHHCLNRR